MLDLALADSLPDWTVDLRRLPEIAEFVAGVVRERYPDLEVPLHARWRHFVLEGRDLWNELCRSRSEDDPAARARSAFDLTICSVFLDAGAGAQWRFRDEASGVCAVRSEGLALAGLRWFARGGFSSDPKSPWRADAKGLRGIDEPMLRAAFQVTDDNPLTGLAGRVALMNRLGEVIERKPELFAAADVPRPGGLFDALRARASRGALPAAELLRTLLEAFGEIWSARPILAGVHLGDCWPHPILTGSSPKDHYVPLHKLSQWLAYSLVEPLETAGLTITELDSLTGLAEYRNGGLFVDGQALIPRDPALAGAVHDVSDPFVVGWRSLTVAMLDRIAPLVRECLGVTASSFPLARILEGGTWAAGRALARSRRVDGSPPFTITSDGTVF